MDTRLKLKPLISLTIFISIIIFRSLADDACPYPCLPPPIAGTTTPATQTGSYPPPVSYSPPSGNLPNYPPPDGSSSSSEGGVTMPPPPDPILPYFPYYFRNGVHRPSDESTSAAPAARSTAMITFAVANLVVSFVLSSSLFW